jgi:hypothetical protein
VQSLQQDVPPLVNDTHSAATDTLLKLVAPLEHHVSGEDKGQAGAIVRTVIVLVRETEPTGWAFFHA